MHREEPGSRLHNSLPIVSLQLSALEILANGGSLGRGEPLEVTEKRSRKRVLWNTKKACLHSTHVHYYKKNIVLMIHFMQMGIFTTEFRIERMIVLCLS